MFSFAGHLDVQQRDSEDSDGDSDQWVNGCNGLCHLLVSPLFTWTGEQGCPKNSTRNQVPVAKMSRGVMILPILDSIHFQV